jgi:hypothetical protein
VGGGVGMREDERLLAEQTIHQTNAVRTDNVCASVWHCNVCAAYRQTRFGASPCSGPVSGHLRRRGLGQTHENKGDVQDDLPHSKKNRT